MAILKHHLPYYREIFALPGMVAEPVLTLGFQTITQCDDQLDFSADNLAELFRANGVTNFATLDPFDPRADFHFDMNEPVPKDQIERYQTLLDIGSIEHVFDTRQCMENSMRMVKVGGRYFIHTPVNGYLYHGLHVFHPQMIVDALKLNSFEIEYLKFTSSMGETLKNPSESRKSLIWIVGRKTCSLNKFVVPQQADYLDEYTEFESTKTPLPTTSGADTVKGKIKYWLKMLCPPIFIKVGILRSLWQKIFVKSPFVGRTERPL